MGKTFRSGHSFPASAGFSGSRGLTSIGGYTRRPPKPKIGGQGKFARTTVPVAGPPMPKPKLRAPMVDPGTALMRAKSRKISQQDVDSGGSQPLLPGYRKGGMAKKC